MFESLDISNLPQRSVGILRRASGTRPAIWIVEENGQRAVVKDFSGNSWFYRNVFGRFLIWREAKAYKKLQGIQGIPSFYGVIQGLAIVIEQIPGRTMRRLEKQKKLDSQFFSKLEELVNKFHSRGIAHCDLKRAPNIILGTDGLPYIIDWGAAISASEFRPYPLSLIYKRLVRDDHMAIIKLKLRHIPESVSPEQRYRYEHRSLPERIIRKIRDILRKTLQRIV